MSEILQSLRKVTGFFLLLSSQSVVGVAQPIPYNPDVRAIVYRANGHAVSGYVRSANDSSITIADDSLVRIQRSAIDSVTFLPREKEHPGYLIGMYGAALFFTELGFGGSGQPFGYIQEQHISSNSALLWLLGVGVGGLVGYAVNDGDHDNLDRTIDLADEHRTNRWDRVKDIIGAPNRRPWLHLGFYTGAIFPRSEYLLEKFAKANGLQEERNGLALLSGANFYQRSDSVFEDFNILRRAEVLIDVWHTPATYEMSIQTGVSFVQLGEPSLGWYHDDHAFKRTYLVQGTYGTGYFLEAAYSYHLGSLHQGFDFSAGAGIGFADMLVDRGYYTEQYPPIGDPLDQSIPYHADWKSVAELAFVQAKANLSRSFSIGLYADAVLAPAQHAEPLPELNIPSYDLHYGNASAGFSLGFNF